MSVLDLMLAGGASSAGPAESDAERIIRLALERRTQYPLSQPSTPSTSPQEVLQRLSAQNAADPRSLAGGINDLAQPLLKKLGPIGGGISKGVDFLEQIGDAARGAAERGVLGGIAPRFSAGVQAAAQRQLEESYRNAQLEIARERNQIARDTDPNSKRRVQSTIPLANGNLGIVMNDPNAPGGFRVVDSENKMGGKAQIFTVPGLGTFKYDPVTDTVESLQDDAAIRKATEELEQSSRRGADLGAADADDVVRAQEAPEVIGKIESNIKRANFFLDALRSGELNTGLLEQAGSTFTGIGQDFRSFTGENVLSLISQATFGALSEGEREFLANISFSLAKDEPVNIRDLERFIELQERILESERAAIARGQAAAPERFEDPQKALEKRGIKVKRN